MPGGSRWFADFRLGLLTEGPVLRLTGIPLAPVLLISFVGDAKTPLGDPPRRLFQPHAVFRVEQMDRCEVGRKRKNLARLG